MWRGRGGRLLLSLLIAGSSLTSVSPIRIQTSLLVGQFPHTKCATQSGAHSLLPTVQQEGATSTYCFTVRAGRPSGSCSDLDRIELNVNSGCNTYNTAVWATINGQPTKVPAAFAQPASAPKGASVLRLTRLASSLGAKASAADGARICLTLSPVRNRAGACDSLAKLCAAPAGAAEGTCSAALHGSSAGCCSLSTTTLDKSAGSVVVSSSQSQAPWSLSAFADPQAAWMWSSRGAAQQARETAVSVFSKEIRLESPTAAVLHLVPDNRCDVYLDGDFIASIQEGWERPEGYWQVPMLLRNRRTQLALRCANTYTGKPGGSSAGVLAALVAEGGSVLARSDDSWAVKLSSSLEEKTGAKHDAEDLGGPSTAPWALTDFADASARWIWTSPWATTKAPVSSVIVFSKAVTAPGPTSATLHIAVDSSADVYINNAYVGTALSSKDSVAASQIPVFLPPGSSTISLRATNQWMGWQNQHPAGVLASVVDASGAVLVRTDSSWSWVATAAKPPVLIAPPSPRPTAHHPSSAHSPRTHVSGAGLPHTPLAPGETPAVVISTDQAQLPWGVTTFADPDAVWIWSEAGAATKAREDTVSIFTQQLKLDSPTAAVFHVVVDNKCDIYLDGDFTASIQEGWDRADNYWQVPLVLRNRKTAITLRCANAYTGAPGGSSAGVLASLIAEDGRVLARTDSTWAVKLTTTLDDKAIGSSHAAFELGVAYSYPWYVNSFIDPAASFIWSSDQALYNAPVTSITIFTKTISVPKATKATLHIIADNAADVYVQGSYVGTAMAGWGKHDNYPQLAVSLPAGDVTIALRATNQWVEWRFVENPAGVLAALVDEAGRVLTKTDSSWVWTTKAGALLSLPPTTETAAKGGDSKGALAAGLLPFPGKAASPDHAPGSDMAWANQGQAHAHTHEAVQASAAAYLTTQLPVADQPAFVISTAQNQAPWNVQSFADSEAKWIWSSESAAEHAAEDVVSVFVKEVRIEPATTVHATLHIATDDKCDLYLNGVFTASVIEGWDRANGSSDREGVWKVPLVLRNPTTQLSLRCANRDTGAPLGSPAGLLAALIADDGSVLARTDASWMFRTTSQLEEKTGSKQAAAELGAAWTFPWYASSFADSGAQWIWTVNTAAQQAPVNTVVVFEKWIYLEKPDNVTVHLVADNAADLYVNTHYMGSAISGWSDANYSMVPLGFPAGNHTVSIRATNQWTRFDEQNPAGMLVSLIDSTGAVLAHSDSSWTVATTSSTPL
ncbi:hypothetical protein HYH03_006522 [Edaphochlamys debaryana]|uniref:Pherophorin domain-containing protein n=1 Tax=Edaphochlamys debaryana TaxID=47281 RepID=A0A836C184_9CHLO|nr:hypothetical protein HYH03_006522 [Edaphochlamys debaryana]|eukprot:KAG2495249.1 hypothetical protein HYH03_006522 [Edaphochlamys debaryana]